MVPSPAEIVDESVDCVMSIVLVALLCVWVLTTVVSSDDEVSDRDIAAMEPALPRNGSAISLSCNESEDVWCSCARPARSRTLAVR